MKQKNLILTIVVLLAINFLAISQNFKISTQSLFHNQQNVNALKSVVDADIKFSKNEIEDYYSKKFKLSFKGKTELLAKEALVPGISTKRMNFYILLEESMLGTTIYNFAQLGFDIYLDTVEYKSEFSAMKRIFSDCLYELNSNYYKEEISDLNKDIKKTNKEIKKLKKENKGLEKKLAKNKKESGKLEMMEGLTGDDLEKHERTLLKLETGTKEYQTDIKFNEKKLIDVKDKLSRLKEDLSKETEKLEKLHSSRAKY